jgi:peroxidase
VQGCDASILLTGNNSEQLAIPNLTVRGFGVITQAKTQLEAVCPGIVSCADIIALAARDAVHLLGGPTYQVETGRLDGLVPGLVVLPAPTDDVETATPEFAAVGLTQEDMVTLLGAHSVGTSQCQFFSDRLWNFNNTLQPDPSLNTTYLLYLQNLCPQNGSGITTVPLNSISEFKLDYSYYTSVRMGQGLLIIDEDIKAHVNTSVLVNNFAGVANSTFSSAFANSYNKMASIGLKTSVNGQVRLVCEVPNS